MNARYLIAAAALALATAANAHDLGQAKYLGNEGILVAKGGTKILFDAFYSESFDGQYSLLPDALETQMAEGRAPFDGVDAVFISHVHPDHFDPRKTIAYMRAQPNVRLYAGRDVVDAIRAGAANDPLMQRVVMVDVPSGGEPAKFAIDGLEIEAFSIPHDGELPIPHYAFRVTLDRSATVMHLGDAGSDDRHFAPYQAAFDKKATNFTFAPVWMLTDAGGRKVIEQRLKPAKAIGVHVEAKERKNPDQARRDTGVDLLIEPGETRPLPHDHK